MEDSDWSSEEEVSVSGLLCAQVFSSVASMMEHHRREFGIDFSAYLSRVEEHNIMLVNFVRHATRHGVNEDTLLSLRQDLQSKAYLQEEFMRPVLQACRS